MSKFLVFSADWETEVSAKSYVDAVLIGTRLAASQRASRFNIAKVVVVIKSKSFNQKSFPSVAVLEDLGLYHLARSLHVYLENLK